MNTKAINTVIPQTMALSADLNTPEDMAMRVELMVEGVTSQTGLSSRIVQQEELTYSASEVNDVTNPAFETMRRIYSGLNPTDRVEVLVYTEDNRLKHAFVDSDMGAGRRGFLLASKYDGAVERMCEELDRFANDLSVPPLTPLEREMSEIIFDDRIVRSVINGY